MVEEAFMIYSQKVIGQRKIMFVTIIMYQLLQHFVL